MLKARVELFRDKAREIVEKIIRTWRRLINRFSFILTIYYAISWISLIAFILSLFLLENSRTIFTQFLWSFYVILQFWFLARSKTLPWKQYISFFLTGAWLVAPFTALFIGLVHFIFGGDTSDFWSSAILTPIFEEVIKLTPLLIVLFISKRASSYSLSDFMLIGQL